MPDDSEEPEDLGSGAKGKRGEYIVIGELLTKGLKVYLPVVDSGIDCIVDIGRGNYREIQIKYRENDSTFRARSFKPRDSFYIVCWLSDRGRQDFWTIPSKVFHELGKSSTISGREYIQLNIGGEGSTNYYKLAEYHHNFGNLLQGATSDVQRAVKTASKRIEGQHFTQQDYEKEILRILAEEKHPLSSKEIVTKIKERMGNSFSKADLARGSHGRIRWETTVRFAIYQGLKKDGSIEAKTKNQWVITPLGRRRLESATASSP